VLTVVEREFVVVVSCLEIIFCHANVSVRDSECCRDCSFEADDRLVRETRVTTLRLLFIFIYINIFNSFGLFEYWYKVFNICHSSKNTLSVSLAFYLRWFSSQMHTSTTVNKKL